MAGQHFRAGVVIIVRHPDDGRVLAFERADVPEAWQLPQGGIELGEDPLDTAWRELREETGLTPDHVVSRREFPEWIVYEWPPEVRTRRRRGQAQRWFLFDALDADVEPVCDGSEFREWRWVDVEWLIGQVVPFRRDAYRRVLGSSFAARAPRAGGSVP